MKRGPASVEPGVTLPDGVRLVLETVRADGTVLTDDEELVVTARPLVAPSGTGRIDVRVEVTPRGAEPVERAVRVRLELADVPDPWWLIPGVFYGANRPVGCFRVFPRFEVGGDDPDAMISDHWEFRADRAATPAVFGWGERAGVALVAEHLSAVGMVGLGFAHHAPTTAGPVAAGQATASVHVTFPFREGPVSYYGSERPLPAEVTTWTWQPGQTITLELAAYLLSADRHGYAQVLREVHDTRRGQAPVVPWVGVAEAADLSAHGLHRWHYDPDPGVLLEAVGFDREVSGQDGKRVDRQAMHVGWVSGIPWAHALLAHGRRVGDAAKVAAAESVIDFICAELSPSGTFWGVWYRQWGWSQSWSPVAGALHARTLGEATLFLLRALALGPDVAAAHPGWVAAARSNLDVITGRQRADGNLGSLHHAESGAVLSWAGASALTWVAALAEAGPYDIDGRYLTAAERAGEYYAPFVDREFIHGAPEDVDLAPTSEDGYAAVMAYVALHRRTGNPRWLDLARRAADWMLTFRYTYDVAFDPRTTLGVYGFASRGADQASPSNQHLHAYGLVCTAELVELSRALGDGHYRERALESLACFRQFVARVDGDFNAYRGMVTERYYQTACFQPKGMVLTLSHAWSVGVLLLACEQAIGLDLAGDTVPDGGA